MRRDVERVFVPQVAETRELSEPVPVVGYDAGDPLSPFHAKSAAHWPRRTMNRQQPSQDEWLDRVRGEYGESPGLTLTLDEAKRLWGLGAAQCRDVLDALVEARFLKRTAHGAYARNEDGV
jgi:hypothetical protein